MDNTERAGGDSGLMGSMTRHWKDATSAREIAEQAYVSGFHFQRVFRSDTGETLGRMRRRLLLERADCSLRTTETPVTVIALEANYQLPEGFARALKTAFGLSPRAYRLAAQRIWLSFTLPSFGPDQKL